MLKVLAVGVGAAALAGVAIRSTLVTALAESRPDLAARVWPHHPQVTLNRGLAEIGQATAAGRKPEPALLDELRDVALRDPLSAEPFMIEGARALGTGLVDRGKALLKEAVVRDPRLSAPRFLLADLALRRGDAGAGLRHIAALIRRLPKAAGPLTPAIATFALEPGTGPQVRALLAGNADLRGKVLSILAERPDQADLVLALAGDVPTPGDWQERLVRAKVRAGDYSGAYRFWSRFAGVPEARGSDLFNSGFQASPAGPPFNWQLLSGAAGTAELRPGGGLELLYYGREPAVLASQLVLLGPGRYRLRTRLEPPNTPALPIGWSIACLPGSTTLAKGSSAAGELVFQVPETSCRAQELQLRGEPSDLAQTTSVVVRDVELRQEGPR